ncbi:MAG: RICIN domain-containing protein [Bdellovibrionia bacterium]
MKTCRAIKSRAFLKRVAPWSGGLALALIASAHPAKAAAVTTVASGAVKSSLGTNICLDVTANSTASGAALEIWSCNGGSNQSFVLNSSGQLKSFAGAGNLCLDIKGTGANLNPIVSKTCNNSVTQKWSLSNGRLVSASSGRCMDVAANNSANGTPVILYDCGAGANQKWSFASGAAPIPSPSPTVTPKPSPSPTPTVKPSPTPSSTSSTGLTIDQVVKDMSSPSEALVINPSFDWQYNPVITQYSPAGSSIPSWWTGERPTWCSGLLAWYTLYEAQGNAATNTRVEIKNLRVYILSNSTRKWSQWNQVTAPDTGLWKYPFASAGTPDRKVESDGGVSFRPAYPYFEHGYGSSSSSGGKGIPNPADVRAVFVAVDTRLVVADSSKPDDRSVAKYVIDTGADYYPTPTTGWSLGYAPGLGNGRYLLATPNWRTATLIVPNKDQGATMTEFLSNPPPMN